MRLVIPSSPGDLSEFSFFDFGSKFLSCERFMEQRVYWEDGVFYFMEECTYCKVY